MHLPSPAALFMTLVLLPGCPSSDADSPDPTDTCGSLAEAGATWELDPGGAAGQIHPRTVLADGLLWTAYNRPDGGSDFGVFVVAHTCEGEVAVSPLRVDAGDGNATDPDLAVSGDRVLLSWQTDDGGSPYNLSVRTAVVDTEGDIVTPDTRLTLTEQGDPIPGQAWMAHPSPQGDGFALAFVRAPEDSAFAIALQALDSTGAPVGDVLSLTDGEQGAFEPSITASSGGHVVAWQDSFDGSAGFRAATVEGTDVTPLSWPMLDANGVGVSLAHAEGITWGAVGRASGVEAGPAGTNGDTVSLTMGLAPGISALPGGAAVAWSEGSPSSATAFVRRVDEDGPTGESVGVATGVGAYPADVVFLGGDLVLVTFAEGSSPAYRVRSEVLALP
ncbi:MAG: hypothetical protein KDA24_12450 [Deltaproteobacteria bacterium]|nr:hypothetical protein [Deltaproteobacteria bacterium]